MPDVGWVGWMIGGQDFPHHGSGHDVLYDGSRYGSRVIGNFADNEAERIWGGTPSRRLPADIQPMARRKPVTPMTWESSITTETSDLAMKTVPNIHPGEVLLEEFLTPMGISQNALARVAGVPPRRINGIVLGKRGVAADTAVRLAAALGTSERLWLGLQADFDLEEAHRALGKTIRNIERIAA